jgi:hypothetical protein
MPSSPHDGTPLLLAAHSGSAASHTPSSSIGSSPHSSGSSSSSLTITHSPLQRVDQATRDASLLRPPHTHADAQGLTPPPAYASLGPNAPSSLWGALAPAPSSHPRFQARDAPPVFDLYTAAVHAQQFGPTPLGRAATVPFAEYIDAPGAADRRAYRRFVSALAVSIGVFGLLSVAVGLEIIGEHGISWVGFKGLGEFKLFSLEVVLDLVLVVTLSKR